MALRDEPSAEYLQAIRRGFQFAREMVRGCGPLDVLVGICEGDGHAAAALDPGPGPSLRAVAAADAALGSGSGYLHMQAQQAAGWLAQARGQRPGPEHLLIALLDQGTPEVVTALGQASLDHAAVRRAALSAIGAPADLPPVDMPEPTPAGTIDRPPLPPGDLDPRAWSVLTWRQDHLPLHRLRRPGDREALARLEQDAAWRVAQRLGLSDDQRYSLIRHHEDAVRQAIAEVSDSTASRPAAGLTGPGLTGAATLDEPGLAGPRGAPGTRARQAARRHRRLRRYGFAGAAVLNATVGWGVWMRNRRIDLHDRWVWLRTLRDYRGCPQP